MKHRSIQNKQIRAPLGLLAGTLLLTSPAAFGMDPCEELRRDCMDYCRYQNPMMDHRECKRECRDRVRDCHGGGMAGPMGYPGARGRSEKTEPDFRGMPEVGAYRGGAPGYGGGAPGYGAPPTGGYGYPASRYPQAGYPGAARQPQVAPPAPAAPSRPTMPQQGQAPAAPAPSTRVPAQPAVPQFPGYGYPPAGPYGGYPPAPYGPHGQPGYGRPY